MCSYLQKPTSWIFDVCARRYKLVGQGRCSPSGVCVLVCVCVYPWVFNVHKCISLK